MRKSSINIIALLCSLFMSACVKLTEVPEGTLAPENFYKTEADFNAATNALYSPLYRTYGTFDWCSTLLLGGGADDVALIQWDDSYARFDKLLPISSQIFISSVWASFYATINNASLLIKNVKTATGLSADKLNEYEGQARFMRAFSYYYLTRFWGKVPLVTEDNQSTPETLNEAEVADVYKLIIADLQIAEDKLAVSYAEKGKATKGAAKLLLADAYLTMTGWPLKDQSYYAKARDKAKEVIDMHVYELVPNIADLWLVANKLTNKESVFAFYGSSRYSWEQGSHYHVETRPGVENGWAGVYGEVRFFNKFPEGPRKEATYHTVFTDGSTWEEDINKCPYIAKFRDAGAAAGQNTNVITTDGDGFIMPLRYADALLIYAEAANMADGTPGAAALDAINQVRVRAGLKPLEAGLSKEQFDNAVFDERGWEFAFECASRWFDLVRKEKVVDINKELYPYVDKHNQLLPKPAKELDLIKGLHQNDGY